MNEKQLKKTMKDLINILKNLSNEEYDTQTMDYLMITYLFDMDSLGEEITLIELFRKFTNSIINIFLKCIQDEQYEVIPFIKSAQAYQIKYLYVLYQDNEEIIEELDIENKIFINETERIVKFYTT